MQLQHISIPHLIAEAHGDPWAINQSLQSGRPAQISDLAKALHGAAQSSNDANAAFEEALRRFEAAWNHENGDHPINDSAEVQRVTQSLHLQAAQLPKIAIDLENIAAALAGAQRSATGQIAMLEGWLQAFDNKLGKALTAEKNIHLTARDWAELEDLISRIQQVAISCTKDALGELESIRTALFGQTADVTDHPAHRGIRPRTHPGAGSPEYSIEG